MTHDFIHTSLYCRFLRPLSENVIKKGGGSPLSFSRYLTSQTSILHHFRLDVIMAFYGKRTFLRFPSCIKTFILKKKRVTIFCSKTNIVRLDDRSLHKRKNMSRSPS